jgi:hypothetical protein
LCYQNTHDAERQAGCGPACAMVRTRPQRPRQETGRKNRACSTERMYYSARGRVTHAAPEYLLLKRPPSALRAFEGSQRRQEHASTDMSSPRGRPLFTPIRGESEKLVRVGAAAERPSPWARRHRGDLNANALIRADPVLNYAHPVGLAPASCDTRPICARSARSVGAVTVRERRLTAGRSRVRGRTSTRRAGDIRP